MAARPGHRPADVAAVCERFFALLPGGRPADDLDARQEQLHAASDAMGDAAFDAKLHELAQQFYALEDDLGERLHAYARRHGLVPGTPAPR